jgi:hypothetical protein
MDMVLKISMTLTGVISLSFLNDPMWQELAQLQIEAKEAREKEYDEYWNSLDYEDQLAAFYSVVKRIYKGEIEEKGTYRYILYDVFDFGSEAYILGMECGYMYLHNAIVDGEEVNT